MDIFERPSQKIKVFLKMLLSIGVLLFICLFFYQAVSQTSEETLEKEQATLEQALHRGAVHTYALEGRYPESLAKLMADYHITYDTDRFVVEYIPEGSNLLPQITVIPLHGQEGGLP
ncbi:MAG: hypothetical protein ACOYBE_04345 [Blautia sp.]|jgi:hypothetical protein